MRAIMRQFVENQLNDETVIEKTARLMFDSAGRADSVVLATIALDGSCISSRPDVFGRFCSDQQMLKTVCSRIDDGQELVISHVDGCTVAASDISCGNERIGYCFMLLADCSPEKSFEYIDFMEIILNQFSTLASLSVRDSQDVMLSRKSSPSEPYSVLVGAN